MRNVARVDESCYLALCITAVAESAVPSNMNDVSIIFNAETVQVKIDSLLIVPVSEKTNDVAVIRNLHCKTGTDIAAFIGLVICLNDGMLKGILAFINKDFLSFDWCFNRLQLPLQRRDKDFLELVSVKALPDIVIHFFKVTAGSI